MAEQTRVRGSPNSILWRYFGTLRNLVARARDSKTRRDEREAAFLAVLVATATVEAFLNILAQNLTEFSSCFEGQRPRIHEDLKKQKGLRQKLKEWPNLLFGSRLELDQGHCQRFLELIDMRNALLHFISSLDEEELGGVRIMGSTDISVYENLRSNDAEAALDCSILIIRDLSRLQNPTGDVEGAVHYWTGIHPESHPNRR